MRILERGDTYCIHTRRFSLQFIFRCHVQNILYIADLNFSRLVFAQHVHLISKAIVSPCNRRAVAVQVDRVLL